MNTYNCINNNHDLTTLHTLIEVDSNTNTFLLVCIDHRHDVIIIIETEVIIENEVIE